MKVVIINGKGYCLRAFAREFNIPYDSVRRYYHSGYRNQSLLNKLKQRSGRKAITINGKHYRSRLKAAQDLGIPTTTFYRYYRNGQLEKLIRQKN